MRRSSPTAVLLAIAAAGAFAGCITPVRSIANTGKLSQYGTPVLPTTCDGPLFSTRTQTSTLTAKVAGLTLFDARPATQRSFSVEIPDRTRTGWNDRVALRLEDHHRELLKSAAEKRVNGAGSPIEVEITVLKATVAWRALAEQESEEVDVELFIRVLDAETEELIASGQVATSGSCKKYDASNETLLQLADVGLTTALADFFERELSSPETIEPAKAEKPYRGDAVVVASEHGHRHDGDSVRSTFQFAAGGGAGAFSGSSVRPTITALNFSYLRATDFGFHAGLDVGIDIFPARVAQYGGGLYVGSRFAKVVPVAETVHLVPSTTLIAGFVMVKKDAWGQSSSALRSAVVDNSSGGGGGFNHHNDVFRNTSGSGGDNADLHLWLGARLGLGIAVHPFGGGAGFTLTPYGQLDWLPVEGVRMSSGLLIGVSYEDWGDPKPMSFAALTR